jgi:xanthine dehydrogenase iron-sulfur cluster and FAD-binding subunit A
MPEAKQQTIRFLLDGQAHEVRGVDPTRTLLEHLRGDLRRTGTKEGCAEGDCGSCTVLVGEPEGEGVSWRAVNSCIQFLPMLHGKALMTVESLAKDGALHPVQQAMVDRHGSQCGFCTPGIVMSLYAKAVAAKGSDAPPTEVLAGNLCRCTGYGPIIEVAKAVEAETAPDVMADLAALDDGAMLDRCRPLDNEASQAAEDSDRHRSGRRAQAHRDRPGRRPHRRGRALCRRHGDAERALSGAWRDDAAAGVDPGAQQRHDRRQHRQRLADRRHAAGPDRSRRNLGAEPWRGAAGDAA